MAIGALLCAVLLSLVTLTAPAAHAGGSAPIIHWDSSMIYAGQNNGNPWGPVGENTIVHGANFPPNTALRLAIAPGDSNLDATVCTQPVVTIPITNLTTDVTGSFTGNFAWPSVAGQVNQIYSICSLLESDYSVASSHDDGPFTVLTSDPPVIDLSASSVAAGSAITITGQNWVPPQPVSVNIAGCAACDPGNTEVTHGNTTSARLNSGTFSLALTIPATTKPGNYVVDALTSSGLEAYYTTGVKHLTITPATATNPTSTATAQSSPTTSTTATATSSHSPTPGATKTTVAASSTTTTTRNSGSSGVGGTDVSNGNNSGLIVLLVGIALVLFLIAAVILFTLMQRRKRQGLNVAPLPSSPFPQGGQHGQPSLPPQGAYQPQQHPMLPSQPAQPAYWQQPQGSSNPAFHGQATEAYVAPNGQLRGVNIPTCPNCGRPLTPNMPTCTTCGMPIAMMRR